MKLACYHLQIFSVTSIERYEYITFGYITKVSGIWVFKRLQICGRPV
jgi:hypothetical protein